MCKVIMKNMILAMLQVKLIYILLIKLKLNYIGNGGASFW